MCIVVADILMTGIARGVAMGYVWPRSRSCHTFSTLCGIWSICWSHKFICWVHKCYYFSGKTINSLESTINSLLCKSHDGKKLSHLIVFSSQRTVNIMKRKKMSSICFPHVAVERLWCHLQDAQTSGYMINQCDKLKNLLNSSIDNHLKQV